MGWRAPEVDFELERGDLLRSAVGGEFVVGPHEVVGKWTWILPNMSAGGSVMPM